MTPRSVDADVPVPVPLQAELVAKVAGYDKNLPARAAGRVRVLIVTKKDDDTSARFARHLESALGEIDRIGGLPHEQTTLSFSGGQALASACKERRTSIVYIAPGFAEQDVNAIGAALSGVNVLSVAADAAEVPKGVVLGFDLVSGKPKIVVHLGQARKQDVQFKAELLKLAKVIE